MKDLQKLMFFSFLLSLNFPVLPFFELKQEYTCIYSGSYLIDRVTNNPIIGSWKEDEWFVHRSNWIVKCGAEIKNSNYKKKVEVAIRVAMFKSLLNDHIDDCKHNRNMAINKDGYPRVLNYYKKELKKAEAEFKTFAKENEKK